MKQVPGDGAGSHSLSTHVLISMCRGGPGGSAVRLPRDSSWWCFWESKNEKERSSICYMG